MRWIFPTTPFTAACVLAVVLLCVQPAFSQIEFFEDLERFSEGSVELQPRNFRTGSVIEEAVSIFGVSFRGEGQSRIIKGRNDIIIDLINPLAIMSFRNEGIDGGPPVGAMIVDLHHPVLRVAFELGNGDPETVALIEAYNPRGASIGSFEVTGIDEKVGPFVGIESQDPSGIAKLVIDYGESERGEQISGVRLDYLTPRPFRRCLPHVGQGTLVGARLQTIIRIVDLGNVLRDDATRVRLELFDDDGEPLQLTLNGATASRFEFELPINSSVQLKTDVDAEFRVGYACIESKYPVGFDAIFRTTLLSTGETLEAGIDARPPAMRQLAAIEIAAQEEINIAVGLVNDSDLEADVFVALWQQTLDGSEFFALERFSMAPRTRRAFFIDELLGQLQHQDFQGTVRITTDFDISATTLRTRRGAAESSIALATMQAFENPRQ